MRSGGIFHMPVKTARLAGLVMLAFIAVPATRAAGESAETGGGEVKLHLGGTPCPPGSVSADYTPGVDAYGRPVVPADTSDTAPLDLHDLTLSGEFETASPVMPLYYLQLHLTGLGATDSRGSCVTVEPQPADNR